MLRIYYLESYNPVTSCVERDSGLAMGCPQIFGVQPFENPATAAAVATTTTTTTTSYDSHIVSEGATDRPRGGAAESAAVRRASTARPSRQQSADRRRSFLAPGPKKRGPPASLPCTRAWLLCAKPSYAAPYQRIRLTAVAQYDQSATRLPKFNNINVDVHDITAAAQ